jgi:hypothetical protein|tara:strand:+ start:42 stop:281 length:240 start_codon:yes stop_codon:yes gene_type:complete
MVKKQELKKPKFTRLDLNKEEAKEAKHKKELAKKSQLPKGIFENKGGNDKNLKSSREMLHQMKKKLDLYEEHYRTKKSM